MTRTVLHVAQPLDKGVPAVAAALVADQLERGWSIAAASPPDGDLRREAERAGARWLPWAARRAPGPSLAGELRELSRIVRAVQPDIVHLHSAKAGLAGRLLLRGGVATVFQPHAWSFEAVTGPVHAATVAWERHGARWADAVVCVSEDERRRGEAAGVRTRFEVVPNGVDVSRYRAGGDEDRRAARAQLGLDGAPLAVNVGRLFHQKGVDVLLAAWHAVLEQVPEAQLALIGDGPERERLVAQAPPAVRFVGDVSDVRPWLAAADVVALPSRWEAGLPLAAMEAMACARSVVAADFAGSRDGVDGDAGAVVPVEDADALARELAARLTDRERVRREGDAGRRRVEERYDSTRSTERIAALYDDVLARRGA